MSAVQAVYLLWHAYERHDEEEAKLLGVYSTAEKAQDGRTMAELPEVVARYQAAHDRGDVDTAAAAFTADATVQDDGRQYHGRDEIRDWLARTSSEFSYTRTLAGATAIDARSWLVINHLEGNFPGGVVDLRYRFVLAQDLIAELQIAP